MPVTCSTANFVAAAAGVLLFPATLAAGLALAADASRASPALSRLQKLRTTLHKPWAQFLLGLCLVVLTVIVGVLLFFHFKYSRLVDAKIKGQIFSTSAKIYATPRTLRLGDTASAHEIGNMLRRSGYTEEDTGAKSNVGVFRYSEGGIVVTPGPESYHNSEAAHISFDGGKVSKIRVENSSQDLGGYELEPQLVTACLLNSSPHTPTGTVPAASSHNSMGLCLSSSSYPARLPNPCPMICSQSRKK